MPHPISINSIEPRQDASAKLLLLTTKRSFTADQIIQIRALVLEINNWDFFVETATAKFSIPLAYKALQTYAEDLVPSSALKAMRIRVRRSSMATLAVVGALLNFQKSCLTPSGARYAYIKGPALSSQFGRPYADRFSRDIDVLVDARDIGRLLEACVSAGYHVFIDSHGTKVAHNRKDLNFIARYAPVVLVLSPEGVPIEVHRQLGKMSVAFDVRNAIENSEEVQLNGILIRTLEKNLHFVYVCYHHARHFWSHLHWLSDIDIIINSSEFEEHSALSLASEIGIRPTIEATINFHYITSHPEEWHELDFDTGKNVVFLKACLANLEGGLELEYALRANKTLGEFIAPWQISRGRYFSLWRKSWENRLRPSVAQHLRYSFPPYLHWMYRVQNLFGLAKNALRLAKSRFEGK